VTKLGFIQLVAGENKAAFLLNLAVLRFKYGAMPAPMQIGDGIGRAAFK